MNEIVSVSELFPSIAPSFGQVPQRFFVRPRRHGFGKILVENFERYELACTADERNSFRKVTVSCSGHLDPLFGTVASIV